MRLRYYKRAGTYFKIIGIQMYNCFKVKPLNLSDNQYPTLKEAVANAARDIDIENILKSNVNNRLIITMLRDGGNTTITENKDNILDFCDFAIFAFNIDFKLINVYFGFRKTIDQSVCAATYDIASKVFVYSDQSVGAMDYFENTCTDRELADYLLHGDTDIGY